VIRVLHVLSDTNIGGAGMHVAGLVKALDSQKIQVVLACPVDAQILKVIDPSIPVIQVKSMAGDKSLDISCIMELASIIKQNKIDIVHTHGSLSGRIAGRIAGIKVVFSRHTPGINYRTGSLKWIINKYLNLLLCNKVIAVSDYIAVQLLAAGIPPSRIATIYNGIDIAAFTGIYNIDALKQQMGFTNRFLLSHIARLEEEKGHKYLFEALARIDYQKYDLKLIVVGDGSQKGKLEQLADIYGIADRVVFTGSINDVKPIIAISDIILLPSLAEALGIALLEGMCMGKPCIAAKVGGIPEVIADGLSGILVEPQQPTALREAIVRLLDNPQLMVTMGQKGRQIVGEKFDLKMKVHNSDIDIS